MKRRLLYATMLVALLAGVAALFSMSASAQQRTFLVKLATGDVIRVTLDADPCAPADSLPLPGTPIEELTAPACGGGGPSLPTDSGGGDQDGDRGDKPPASSGGGDQDSGDKPGRKPSSGGGESQDRERGKKKGDRARNDDEPQSEAERELAKERKKKAREKQAERTPLRNRDGTPTRNNPTFFDALPTPAPGTAVPNFVIRKFQVPIFLLPIYQAAGIQYGIRWEILAAINEIETDYGRNLNVSTAGAVGWMQFMPATWRMYGTDANDDGKKDPYNPVDAIFAAARYLKAAGAEQDLRRAIFAYNHADWYVDSVMLRAKLIAGVPGDLVGSLTGLTQGRFPVAARARYANDVLERELKRRVKKGENAANVMEDADRRSIDIFSENGAPVVAANDGVIKKIGVSDRLGRYIVLQDVYGNRYTYSGLGSVSQLYPVPKVDLDVEDNSAKAVSANAGDPKPDLPASAGRQVSRAKTTADDSDTVTRAGSNATATYKPRIFAHPYRSNPRKNGAIEQIFNRATSQKGFATYKGLFAHVYGLNAKNAVLRPLQRGSRVIAGTLLGRVGRPDQEKAAHVTFSIRPAGRGAPTIDPKPILDGWKLLESTAIYRANGKNALYSSSDAFSIGQILLLPKPLLQKRVLSDERLEIYPGGRADIRAGQIDRRVLATLEFLAESGLRPTVTSLKTGHSKFTSSGNVSHHWHGSAVDIAQINGVSILGHQDKGGVTDQAVKRLMLLQGTMRPAQIISLLDFGANTVAMGDHHDHIHVGFRPLYGENAKLGKQTLAVLKPGQWSDLINRLRELENPVVRTTPSKYALPAKKNRRHSDAHRGE
ncbi:MAG: lytic murein transglycosylase [Actinomycetota bacterium]|nr:lytic murein transglycosylase [Actinomycetota bacterium]